VSGQLLTTMITNQATPNAWANSTNWLNVQAGINDLAGGATGAAVEANFNTYCTAAISAGFSKANISVETISIAQTAYVTERDNFNTALRANYTGYAGWLFDVAADTVLGCTPASGLITPSLFGDSLHPNDAGHMAKAVLYRSTIGSSLPW
jgi:cellobiose phosphorylase